MNDCELHELLTNCPSLYHMAERGAWEGIRANGLLSTSALLCLYDVCGTRRFQLESQRRSEIVTLRSHGLPMAKLRDQLAMDDSDLERCLKDGITPQRWYEIINSRVFFWLTKKRLEKFSEARSYRDGEREVLVLNSRSLVDAYREKVWLCPINSGATFKPKPYPRGHDTFSRIANYPYSQRPRGERRVVELCVDCGIPDVTPFIERVYVVKGKREVTELPL